jgi:hypothetical protein
MKKFRELRRYVKFDSILGKYFGLFWVGGILIWISSAFFKSPLIYVFGLTLAFSPLLLWSSRIALGLWHKILYSREESIIGFAMACVFSLLMLFSGGFIVVNILGLLGIYIHG